MVELTERDEERFWSKVERGDADECWLWQAGENSEGYGMFWLDGSMAAAHRVGAKLGGLDLDVFPGHPTGEQVNHRCHTPKCVNANHLYVGTHTENMQDGPRRGPLSHGEARKLCERYETEDVTQVELADEYGITQSAVSKIVNSQ
jgi:hypothetical protein